jgi:hypothetical protein
MRNINMARQPKVRDLENDIPVFRMMRH